MFSTRNSQKICTTLQMKRVEHPERQCRLQQFFKDLFTWSYLIFILCVFTGKNYYSKRENEQRDKAPASESHRPAPRGSGRQHQSLQQWMLLVCCVICQGSSQGLRARDFSWGWLLWSPSTRQVPTVQVPEERQVFSGHSICAPTIQGQQAALPTLGTF